jgi:Ca2+/H+ antiporter
VNADTGLPPFEAPLPAALQAEMALHVAPLIGLTIEGVEAFLTALRSDLRREVIVAFGYHSTPL